MVAVQPFAQNLPRRLHRDEHVVVEGKRIDADALFPEFHVVRFLIELANELVGPIVGIPLVWLQSGATGVHNRLLTPKAFMWWANTMAWVRKRAKIAPRHPS